MKKVISLLVIFSIVLAMSVTAFAVPTIEYVFGGTEEDGNYYYYMFGKNNTDATEVGITIEGKEKLFNLNTEGLATAQTSGKYGIGVADPLNKLGASFKVTPYQVVSDVKETGVEQPIVKEEVINSDEIEEVNVALPSLSVKNAEGDELISDFDAATTTYYVPVSALTDELTVTAQADNAETTTVKEDANNQYVITVTGENEESNTYYVKYRVPVTAEITYNSVETANGGSYTAYVDSVVPNTNWFGSGVDGLRLRGSWNSYMEYKIDTTSDIKLISATLSETGARISNSSTVDETKDDIVSVYQNVKNYEDVYDSENAKLKDLLKLELVNENEAVLLNSYKITEDWVASNSIKTTPNGKSTYKIFRIPEMTLDVSKMKVYEGNVIILYAKSDKEIIKSNKPQFLLYVPPVLTVEYIVCD